MNRRSTRRGVTARAKAPRPSVRLNKNKKTQSTENENEDVPARNTRSRAKTSGKKKGVEPESKDKPVKRKVARTKIKKKSATKQVPKTNNEDAPARNTRSRAKSTAEKKVVEIKSKEKPAKKKVAGTKIMDESAKKKVAGPESKDQPTPESRSCLKDSTKKPRATRGMKRKDQKTVDFNDTISVKIISPRTSSDGRDTLAASNDDTVESSTPREPAGAVKKRMTTRSMKSEDKSDISESPSLPSRTSKKRRKDDDNDNPPKKQARSTSAGKKQPTRALRSRKG